MAKTPESDPIDVPAGVSEERVDALYGLPLDEFTSARDALAKELRKEGQQEAAAWVKGLRKPSGPAWVINQLARTQGVQVKELQAAEQAMRERHERLMAGEGGSEELQDAAGRQREAITGLIEKAHGLLDSSGHGPSRATLEKARQTLEAVALDEGTRAAFAAGRVTRETRPVGLGLMAAPAPAPRKAKARGADQGRAGRDKSRANQRAKLRREHEAAKGEERRQRQAVERAQQGVEEARGELEQAQSRLAEAEAKLESARRAHSEAQSRVDETDRALAELS
jgi:hypothetical protein